MKDKHQEKTDLKAPAEQANLAAVPDFGAYAGEGMDNVGKGDVQIPFLSLLQALSPQVTAGDPKYIEGAKPGDLVNSVTNELIGKEAYFVACCKDSLYVEWIPRDEGGGLVGMHEVGSQFVTAVKAENSDKFRLKTRDGHDLIETHYVYGMLIEGPDGKTEETPIVIGFSSSKIKVYKAQLMTRIRTIKGNPPMFAFRWRVTSVQDKNKQGQPFFNFKIEPVNGDMMESANLPGSDHEGLLKEGKLLVEAVRGGKAKAAVESEGAPAGAASEDEPF